MTAVDATRAAFLADVIAHPDDDTPRLIFADWLEEHGEEERGEFIRLQITRETDPDWHGFLCLLKNPCKNCRREMKLTGLSDGRHGNTFCAWSRPMPPYNDGDGCTWQFRRGFVHSVTLPAADWLAHADALTRAHPIREVRLTTWPVLECPNSDSSGRAFRLAGRGKAEWWGIASETVSYRRNVITRYLLKREWPLLTFALLPP